VDSVYPDALSFLLSIRDQRRADSGPTNDFEWHAWITVNQGGNADTSSWPPRSKLQPYMLKAVFPEFVVKSGKDYRNDDPRYVSPQSSAVEQLRFRQHIVDLINGLVEDYAVDGVHLDYVRVAALCFNNEALTYPNLQFNYPGCQADCQQWTLPTYGRAYSLWDDIDGDRGIRDGGSGRVAARQVRTVSLLVKVIHAAIKAARPATLIRWRLCAMCRDRHLSRARPPGPGWFKAGLMFCAQRCIWKARSLSWIGWSACARPSRLFPSATLSSPASPRTTSIIGPAKSGPTRCWNG
jgi:hypothetical protein